eukprot:3497112-Pyramimonas_sp.AAC.2
MGSPICCAQCSAHRQPKPNLLSRSVTPLSVGRPNPNWEHSLASVRSCMNESAKGARKEEC